jgi:putative SOS response-associated peptidase YedK
MCRRFTVTSKPEAVAKHFDATLVEKFQSDKIYAPLDFVPMIVESRKSKERELRVARFGIIPSFAIDPSVGKKLYNCRAETVNMKPSFRASFEARRCLIPANAFYEWHLHNKEPHEVTAAKGGLMAFAGIWDRWRDPMNDDVVVSLTIITTDAAGDLATIHQRMPAILDKDAQAAWLDPKAKEADLMALLKPYAKINIALSSEVMAA